MTMLEVVGLHESLRMCFHAVLAGFFFVDLVVFSRSCECNATQSHNEHCATIGPRTQRNNENMEARALQLSTAGPAQEAARAAMRQLVDYNQRGADATAAEAEALENSDPHRAAILDFIAQRARAADDLTPQSLLDELGADYFKFAALQVDQESPRLAYRLMALARHLRPGAPFIEERLAQYRDKLGES